MGLHTEVKLLSTWNALVFQALSTYVSRCQLPVRASTFSILRVHNFSHQTYNTLNPFFSPEIDIR